MAALVIASIAISDCQNRKPPYSPQEALKTFQLPEGFRLELVAAEPDIVNPIAMAFDEQGRLYVVEMRDYPISDEPLSRIKLLEDRDGDGRYEHSTVFVDGLHFAHGVMPWKQGVIVTCAPDILYYRDTDGDGKADERRVIVTGFARVNPQLRVNAPTYGIDNWIYAAYPKFGRGNRFKQFSDLGKPLYYPDHPEVAPVDVFAKGMDLRFKPDQLKLEAVSGNSEFGLAFDARGHRFPSWNDKHAQHAVIENRYLARNPYLAVESAVQSMSDHGAAAEVYPITDNSDLKEIRSTALISELGHFTSACGQSIYNGGKFPEKYEGAYFICEPVSNLVHCDLLTPQGATFIARREREKSEFLASKDSWFKPVFTTVGPDGALYVVDFHRKIVEHPEWIRKEYVNDRKLFYAGNDCGRIYRIVKDDSVRAPKPMLKNTNASQLVKELSNPNSWWRLTSQRLLVERQELDAVPALKEMATKGVLAEGRVHALWVLAGLSAMTVELIVKALQDQSPMVREQAVLLAEDHISDPLVTKRLREMSSDSDDRVVFQLACTLGGLPAAQSFEVLKSIVTRHIEDPWYQMAVLSAAAKNSNQWFQAMIKDPAFVQEHSKGREDFLRRIASIIGAKQSASEINAVLASVSFRQDLDEQWRVAALEGLAEGLKQGTKSRMKLSGEGQEKLLKLVETQSPELSKSAFEVAASSELEASGRLRNLIKKAAESAKKRDVTVESRVGATRMIGLDPTHSTSAVLEQLLVPQEPEEVQVAAARALLNQSDTKSLEVLLKKWQSYTTPVREVVLEGFFKNSGSLHVLLDAIKTDKVKPWSLSRSRRMQLLRSGDEDVRKQAETLFAGIPNDRQSIIEKYRRAVLVNGDIDRGKQIFNKKCSRCHKIGGAEVGPDLLTITKWDKAQLLENILDPSANVVPGYEEYLMETKDGNMITGVMVQESETTVTLRRSKGDEDTVLRSNIASLRAGTVSAMPEGLEDEISVEQMTDLLEFLRSLRSAAVPKTVIHGHF
jgi:putative membrane-bound dehydrogenase-like protein